MTDKTEAPERRVTFGNETPETSDVVLCNYCGESLHDVEHGVFYATGKWCQQKEQPNDRQSSKYD